LVLISSGICYAQDVSPEVGAVAGIGCFLFVIFAFMVINIAILIWVIGDAKNRGMENPVLWLGMVFFTGIIGLFIYFLARPEGNLAPCPRCGNKKIVLSNYCPHCKGRL